MVKRTVALCNDHHNGELFSTLSNIKPVDGTCMICGKETKVISIIRLFPDSSEKYITIKNTSNPIRVVSDDEGGYLAVQKILIPAENVPALIEWLESEQD